MVNKDGKKIYFNDYIIPSQLAIRNREKDIKDEMAERQVAHKKEIKKNKDGLQIGEKQYVKCVKVPEPADMVLMNEAQITKIIEAKVFQGEYLCQKNSRFVAYTMEAGNFDDIESGYMNIRTKHPGARHVAAVWVLPGIQKQEVEDFQEDQEHGLGCLILKKMKASNIINRVIYLVRYYGGIRMGTERFDCYIQAAKTALEGAPVNSISCHQDAFNMEDAYDKRETPAVNNEKSSDKNYRGGNGRQGRGYKSRGGSPKRTYRPVDEKTIEEKLEERRKSYAGALRGAQFNNNDVD